jgi:hypothetical protein
MSTCGVDTIIVDCKVRALLICTILQTLCVYVCACVYVYMCMNVCVCVYDDFINHLAYIAIVSIESVCLRVCVYAYMCVCFCVQGHLLCT